MKECPPPVFGSLADIVYRIDPDDLRWAGACARMGERQAMEALARAERKRRRILRKWAMKLLHERSPLP